MQIVLWGKKRKQTKVPVGWKFLKSGQRINDKDKYFNLLTHTWDNVVPTLIDSIVGQSDADIIIRNDMYSERNQIDRDRHAIRTIN